MQLNVEMDGNTSGFIYVVLNVFPFKVPWERITHSGKLILGTISLRQSKREYDNLTVDSEKIIV